MSARKALFSILGSLVPSFFAATCCLAPTLFVLFGASMGGVSVFTFLEPYRPLFILAALTLLAYAFFHLYIRPPRYDCVRNGASALRAGRFLFWVGSVIFAVAVLYPILLPRFFL